MNTCMVLPMHQVLSSQLMSGVLLYRWINGGAESSETRPRLFGQGAAQTGVAPASLAPSTMAGGVPGHVGQGF